MKMKNYLSVIVPSGTDSPIEQFWVNVSHREILRLDSQFKSDPRRQFQMRRVGDDLSQEDHLDLYGSDEHGQRFFRIVRI